MTTSMLKINILLLKNLIFLPEVFRIKESYNLIGQEHFGLWLVNHDFTGS